MVEYFQGGGAEVIVCQGSALSYPWHSHVSTLTLGAVLEGVVELETDQGTGIYRENGLFALPPYMPHSLKAGSPYTLVSLCVRKAPAASGVFREARESAAALLRRAVGLPEVEERLLEELSLLSGRRSGEGEGPLAELRARLEREPELPCSLEDMAELACMSKYHLVRAFRREAGLTPHRVQVPNRVREGQGTAAGGTGYRGGGRRCGGLLRPEPLRPSVQAPGGPDPGGLQAVLHRVFRILKKGRDEFG